MKFATDKQTFDDLNILGRYKNNSIFSLFNHAVTAGGGRLLEQMFKEPLTSTESINTRTKLFSFFEKADISLPFDKYEFETIENYLLSSESGNRIAAAVNISKSRISNILINEKDYLVLQQGLEKTIQVFSILKELIVKVEKLSLNSAYHKKAKKIKDLLDNKHLEMAWKCVGESPLSFMKMLKLDYVFRGLLNDEMRDLLNEMYELDVYITVSNISRKKGYTYAKGVEKSEKFIDIKGLYHPCIPNATVNDVHIGKDKNVFFLTGANMAGKSTFMKSFGIAAYLAHMGFPVAAREMTFSLHQGIYTSINVSDNLSKGYSHFYAEVLRVKHVAKEVASNKQLVIIFDELFKGTNVKDAFDGTVAVIDAFSKRDGNFIISTHIMEAGKTLQKTNPNLFFKYLPTIMKGNIPSYTYILQDGITEDRQGMTIIKNEKILEIIKGENTQKRSD